MRTLRKDTEDTSQERTGGVGPSGHPPPPRSLPRDFQDDVTAEDWNYVLGVIRDQPVRANRGPRLHPFRISDWELTLHLETQGTVKRFLSYHGACLQKRKLV